MRPENVLFNPRHRAQNIHLSSALFSRASICTVQFVSFFVESSKLDWKVDSELQTSEISEANVHGWMKPVIHKRIRWMKAPKSPLMESKIIKFSADFFAPENVSDWFFAAKIKSKLSLSVSRIRILIKKNDKSRQCTDYSEASLIFPVIRLITEPIEYH